ncbi:hypothetical protein EVAR_48654_1 [Eumeta japonica]|uniref:Uncharacterized protein n=1 Tax=Eumeta variegata TaxID=151549 RepID=A0A4C1X7B2_EUMVA|nr:hypothetical protein EVAR_48654_1 [Eumeta japonica]
MERYTSMKRWWLDDQKIGFESIKRHGVLSYLWRPTTYERNIEDGSEKNYGMSMEIASYTTAFFARYSDLKTLPPAVASVSCVTKKCGRSKLHSLYLGEYVKLLVMDVFILLVTSGLRSEIGQFDGLKCVRVLVDRSLSSAPLASITPLPSVPHFPFIYPYQEGGKAPVTPTSLLVSMRGNGLLVLVPESLGSQTLRLMQPTANWME